MTNDLDAAMGIFRAAAIGLALWIVLFGVVNYWL